MFKPVNRLGLVSKVCDMNQSRLATFIKGGKTKCHGILLENRKIVANSFLTTNLTEVVEYSNGVVGYINKIKSVDGVGLKVFQAPMCPQTDELRKHTGRLSQGGMVFVLRDNAVWYAEAQRARRVMDNFTTKDGNLAFITNSFSGSLAMTKHGEVLGILHGFSAKDDNLWMCISLDTLISTSNP